MLLHVLLKYMFAICSPEQLIEKELVYVTKRNLVAIFIVLQ